MGCGAYPGADLDRGRLDMGAGEKALRGAWRAGDSMAQARIELALRAEAGTDETIGTAGGPGEVAKA